MAGASDNTNKMPFDYSTLNPSSSDHSYKKAPFFNGDAATFEWWKDKIYSHITGIDDELWDIVEEGVT
ncbi:F-box/LRR-repeat protein, partial [Trifolium medium]|nr:F-box/LRR-repeat protein [Trifolium medium]